MTTPNSGSNFNDYTKLDGSIPFLNRKLTRSKTNKVVTGVLGGIGETYGIDPNVLRILFLVSMLFPGPQILIYIVAAVLMWNT
ncbi:PspC domain-containing protein [Corynebacterium sp. H128]|uniref:PspC domain-containing protein n=1 Tax=unclassified Corynebacterium TaxID=2624378 RepID=UPI0030B19B8B